MLELTAEQKQIGANNFHEAVGVTRRDFVKGVAAAGVASGAGLGAMYFGYDRKIADPVRVGVIGTGDEGNVLIGGCTPDFVNVVAIADIRPSSIHRAFHGDWSSDAALKARPGLIKQYGYSSEAEARKHVKVYDHTNGGIQALLDDDSIEAVIIALPLWLHAPIAIQAMTHKNKKHVLTEKLMAHNIAECKVMARVSADQGVHCATGHQRHYSVLYDNAVHLLRYGLLGQLHHIRAQWHRGNLPGGDSWQVPLPGDEKIRKDLKNYQDALNDPENKSDKESLEKKVAQWSAWLLDKEVQAAKFGYEDKVLEYGRTRTAMEELVRWRLWQRTGGGLMAELGSHQLDAASIFCSALRQDGKKAHPLTVHAVGGRHIFPADREVEDHVYCTYEFPGPEYEKDFDLGYYNKVDDFPPKGKSLPGYEKDPNKKIVVTYSSINGNGFGGYGEVVMGTKGTLVLEQEKETMLYKSADVSAKVSVKKDKGSYQLDTQASGSYSAAATSKLAVGEDISRGYTEEIEHWAWCIRNPDPNNLPRCYPEVAMGDAVIALTSNIAMAKQAKGEPGFVKFDENWFDVKSDATPDGSVVADQMTRLTTWKVV
jgi:predicted dehydrogenase